MALYTISDLHLPLGVDKPMDIFGSAWANYVERLRDNWQSVVKSGDTVVLGGDFSWATYLDEAKADFEFLNALNGRKILLKGNHDYWWETASKLNKYVAADGWENIFFLHNNFFEADGTVICGTRGWSVPVGNTSDEDKKMYSRELGRLKMSINAARKAAGELVVFLHYPPLLKDYRDNEMTALLENEGIKRCFYGHIHKTGAKNAFEGEHHGVEYRLCACDYLGFMPIKVAD